MRLQENGLSIFTWNTSGRTNASRQFCVAIICPALSAAERSPSRHAATQPKSVYISGNDSSRRPGPLDITPNVSLTITRHLQAALPRGRSHCSKHLSETSLPHVCVILVSFWIANDKWCFEEESYRCTWQWGALKKKKKGNNGTLDWSFWRSHLQLLLNHKAALFYSEGFRWAQWVWADLKNNEVDVLFYRLNNEVVCFREQPQPPSLSQRLHPPSSPPLWWSWYMHKQHFHGVPSIGGFEAWCPYLCLILWLLIISTWNASRMKPFDLKPACYNHWWNSGFYVLLVCCCSQR